MVDKHTYTVHEGCDHIFFIGFMGAGKTTVARNLGRLFNRRYLDTDKLVALRAHRSVGQVYRDEGVKGYRFRETAVLESLFDEQSCLISCGDGIVETARNLELFKEMGKVVYLDIDLDGALAQIRSTSNRPLLGDYENARELYAKRRPLYQAAADYTVNIRDMDFKEVAYKVGELLWEEGLL